METGATSAPPNGVHSCPLCPNVDRRWSGNNNLCKDMLSRRCVWGPGRCQRLVQLVQKDEETGGAWAVGADGV